MTQILIVDDSSTARRMVKHALVSAGHEEDRLQMAKNGREALEMLQSLSFDAVVCDLIMPELGGDGLLEALNANPPANGRPPFIMLTSMANPEISARLHELGAKAVLTKPFRTDLLQNALNTAITGEEAEAECDEERWLEGDELDQSIQLVCEQTLFAYVDRTDELESVSGRVSTTRIRIDGEPSYWLEVSIKELTLNQIGAILAQGGEPPDPEDLLAEIANMVGGEYIRAAKLNGARLDVPITRTRDGVSKRGRIYVINSNPDDLIVVTLKETRTRLFR